MDRKSAAICLLALAAPGCGGPAAPQAAQAPETSPLRPGKWVLTIHEEAGNRRRNVPLPGTQERPPREVEICLSAAQAAEPSPELLADFRFGDRCRRDVFGMADGNLNAVLMCRGFGGGDGEVPQRIWGRYARESYRLTHEGGPGQMRITTRVEGRYAGACGRGRRK